MQNNSKLLTIGESATYLGVSIDTLRRWDNKGIIYAYRSPSGHRYFNKNDLSKLFGQKYVRTAETEKREDKDVIQPPPRQQMIQKINIEEPSQKTLPGQITTTTILNPPEVIATKPQDLSSQNQPTKFTKPKKMDLSWTTLIIIGLTLFTVVDLILLIMYFTSAKPLASPIP